MIAPFFRAVKSPTRGARAANEKKKNARSARLLTHGTLERKDLLLEEDIRSRFHQRRVKRFDSGIFPSWLLLRKRTETQQAPTIATSGWPAAARLGRTPLYFSSFCVFLLLALPNHLPPAVVDPVNSRLV